MYFDSTGNARERSLTKDNFNQLLSAYTKYLYYICPDKENFLGQLNKISEFKQNENLLQLIESTKASSYKQNTDIGFLQKLDIWFNNGERVNKYTIAVSTNKNNKQLSDFITLINTNPQESSFFTNWYKAKDIVSATKNDKSISKGHKATIISLYETAHENTFGKDTAKYKINMPTELQIDPKWVCLSDNERLNILSNKELLETWHTNLIERHNKNSIIEYFLGIPKDNHSFKDLTYKLSEQLNPEQPIDLSKFKEITSGHLIDLTQEARVELLNSLISFPKGFSKDQIEFDNILRYTLKCITSENVELKYLYSELIQSSLDSDINSIINRYNFSNNLPQCSECDLAQAQILKLVKSASEQVGAFSKYFTRLAGVAQNALNMGRYQEAIRIANLPAEQLGTDLDNLTDTIITIGIPDSVRTLMKEDDLEKARSQLSNYSKLLGISLESTSYTKNQADMKELEVIDKLQYLSKYVRYLHVMLNDKITKLPDITSLDSIRKSRVYNKILDASTCISKVINNAHANGEKEIALNTSELLVRKINVMLEADKKQLVIMIERDLLPDFSRVVREYEKQTGQSIESNGITRRSNNLYTVLGASFLEDLQNKTLTISDRAQLIMVDEETGNYISEQEITNLLSIPEMSLSYQVVANGEDAIAGGWKELTPEELDKIKRIPNTYVLFKADQIISAEDDALIKAACGSEPPLNKPPKKDDEKKEEVDNLIDELNEMIQKAEIDWELISDKLKEVGIEIAPEELKALYKPESGNHHHMFRIDYKSKYIPETNDYIGRVSGHHLDKGNNLARKGLVQYEYIVEHPNKCWDATLRIGNLTKARNSYFPSHWDEKDCMKAIIEAMQKPSSAIINNRGNLQIDGICKSSIKIRIILDKSKSINTAFPIRGQK